MKQENKDSSLLGKNLNLASMWGGIIMMMLSVAMYGYKPSPIYRDGQVIIGILVFLMGLYIFIGNIIEGRKK